MSALSLIARRSTGCLASNNRCMPMACSRLLSTRPKLKEEFDFSECEEHAFHPFAHPKPRGKELWEDSIIRGRKHANYPKQTNNEFFGSMEMMTMIGKVHKIKDRNYAQLLQKIFIDAKSSQAYACDAPDGHPDGALKEELQEVHQILDKMMNQKEDVEARLERMAKLIRSSRQAAPSYAVDAPDGEVDGHIQEELEEVKHMMDEHINYETYKSNHVESKEERQENQHRQRAGDPEHW